MAHWKGWRWTVALTVGLVSASCTVPADGAQDSGTTVEPVVVPADLQTALDRADKARAKGAEDAAIRIVEISDFECPFCAQFYNETYAALDSQYVASGRVSYVWISYANPGHPKAWPSTEAAFCAGAVGLFWPMHDILFERQEDWRATDEPFDVFVSYAEELNIDTDSFARCMREDQLAPLQIRDYTNVVRAGITSTPYFILGDSVAVRGAAPLESFQSAIDTLLVLRGGAESGSDEE